MDNKIELLTPEDVDRIAQIAPATQAQWRFRNSHGFRALVVKLGRCVRYDRAKFEAWLKERAA
ncbi:helix-turn-helix domain-containing protein [Azotobacter beijerinckii]|uniref:helix-turn-helix domain-containing protein n=1 Tax=Azotobacter beijerinckii TaxID=170623 RepID=UPI002953D7A0|nr:helix-turn-helix domain-containing protein [Azotobacter beijerinckii]MDV7210785.1 helix-turn-helix domain-containing protein [Azotobacter beijerinckii]